MTYRCAACNVSWYVYMTNKGACPACGGGTVRTNDSVSPDAKALWEALKAKGRSADLHVRFEEFYAQRDPLEHLAKLPTVEPPA